MDETYVRVKGEWKYVYRAVDKEGHTIDLLLTPHRDQDAAEAFLHKAIRTQGLPEKMTIDQSGRNTAAMTHYNNLTRQPSRSGSVSISTTWPSRTTGQ